MPAAPERDRPAPSTYTPRHLAERILDSRNALEGERKVVTVLFCDLVESTPLAERIGAEAMHGVMDRCFRAILEQVHRFEGTVNQFLGDGVMALFGAPLALEDAPRCAANAALGIQRAIEPLRAELLESHGADLQMRVALHSGPVVVGSIGDDLRMDYTAVGDTSNLAARLQQAALPGTVLVSQAVEGAIAGYFELRERGPLTLKGKAEPVRAFEILRERPAGSRIEVHAESGLTPLVGRGREFEALTRAFDLANAGHGQVAFLVGEAGIGKSRLLYEFRQRLADTDHAWMEGRCASHARSTAFYALGDAIRRTLGIENRDDDATALRKLEESETRQGGDLAWTLPLVRGLLSLPIASAEVEQLDAATRRSETARALRDRVLRAARDRPLVIVFEDLHWIDRSSEDFLSFLIESIPAARVLVLLTHRPGYQHPFGDRSYHQRLSLQSLSPDEVETMAGSVLEAHALPDAVHRILAQKADGNPFFVEEVAQSMLEDGTLERRDGRIELTRRPDAIAVPDRIQDVLMARLDRLADEPKRAIQVASVIGREFALRLLERATSAAAGLQPIVDELRSLELIYEKSLHPELAFMFKHALTHDVAYESVLESRRRALHRMVGNAIEELYADRLPEHYEDLAHHFSESGEWARAFVYHDKAAQKSAEAFANQAAIEHWRAAVEMAPRAQPVASQEVLQRIAEQLGGACFLVSDYEESGIAYERAASLASGPEERAMNLGRAGYSYQWSHEYESVQRVTEEAERVAHEHGVPAAASIAILVRGFVAGTCNGDMASYERLLAEGTELGTGIPEVEAFAAFLHGEAAEWRGHYQRAVDLHARSIELAKIHRMPQYGIVAAWFQGKALCCQGRYGDALRGLREAQDMTLRVGDRAQRARLLNTLGWLHAEVGDHAEAVELNQRSADVAYEMLDLGLAHDVPELLGNAAANLAGSRVALGDLDGAEEAFARIDVILDETDDLWMRWRFGLHLEHARARLALQRGAHAEAFACLGRELEGARRHEAPKLEARSLELRARIELHQDDREQAERSARQAHAVANRIGYPPVLWRCESLLSEIARRSGDDTRAGELAASAHRRIATRVSDLPPELRGPFAALGEQLIETPLTAHR